MHELIPVRLDPFDVSVGDADRPDCIRNVGATGNVELALFEFLQSSGPHVSPVRGSFTATFRTIQRTTMRKYAAQAASR